MNKQEVMKKLKTIILPELNKDVIELNLIESLSIKPKSLHARIDTSNKKIFNFIAREIPKLFKDEFRDIEIEKKVKKTKKIIAISGKGGVGKSTVSANFSVALAQNGYKVGFLDADLYGSNIPHLFKIKNKKLQLNDKNKIIPYESFGVKVVSAEVTNPLSLKNSDTTSVLTQFLDGTEWGELDFLIIDMPFSENIQPICVTEKLPLFGIIFVTTPQILTCNYVSRSVIIYKDIHVKILGIVENMSYFIAPDTGKKYNIFGKDGGKKISEKYNLNLLGQIPFNIDIKEALSDEKIKDRYKKIVKKAKI